MFSEAILLPPQTIVKHKNFKRGDFLEFVNIEQVWYIIRMIAAALCGGLIGLERKNRAKEAGIRTHFVVACASALMMIISKYGFLDITIGEAGARGADGARIAAQVVSGIGFLGAGMIFVHKNTVTGLTTAAGIWATSGVGLAIGAGMYIVGISCTLLIILAQILLHKNFAWLKIPKSKKLVVKNVTVKGYQQYIANLFEAQGIIIHDVHIEKGDDGSTYTFMLEIPPQVSEENILDMIDHKCKISTSA